MNIFSWWPEWLGASTTGLSRFRRGAVLANQHDSPGAMEQYTAAIETPGVLDDVKAMALYNRALLFSASKDWEQAEADLNAILAMPAPLRQFKSAAHQKLDRMRHVGHAVKEP
jgi:hypothetical protein